MPTTTRVASPPQDPHASLAALALVVRLCDVARSHGELVAVSTADLVAVLDELHRAWAERALLREVLVAARALTEADGIGGACVAGSVLREAVERAAKRGL